MYDKIVFLVSSLSQPRAIRRVESIAALGYEVEVYGYDRVQYNCNKFSVKIPVTILGQMSKEGNPYAISEISYAYGTPFRRRKMLSK